jgi:hypothetical protein
VMGWHGDVNHGDEVAASDRPGQNGCAYKDAQHRRVGRRVASSCPTSSDRRAQAEEAVCDMCGRSQVISNQNLNAEN